MKEFMGSIDFIIFFLVLTLGFSLLFGEKATTLFLLLILMGMVYSNLDKFTELLRRFSHV